jgi:iron complex transport system permease protein
LSRFKQHRFSFALFGLLLVLLVAELLLGSVEISIDDVFTALFASDQSSSSYIITQLRLPRAVMAIIAGSGLSIAGLLMQSLFRNPLAGPFVLGISSGAGLGVALVVLGASALGFAFAGYGTIVIASILGSIAVLLITLFVSLRIRDTMGLLIIGLMVGSLSSAVVGILSYFSASEELKRYVFWSLGSLGGVNWNSLIILSAVFLACCILTFSIVRPLNLLLLGETYARSLGVNITRMRWLMIIVTSLLAGSITAFAGPIAFVGLAVPHLCRLVLPTVNYKVLLPAVILLGACLMMVCDIIAQVPYSSYTLPINAITSIIGAPIVIWLIVRKKGLQF